MTAQQTELSTDEVVAMVRGLTLLHIEWLRRQVRDRDAAGAPDQAMDELAAVLRDAGTTADPVLTDPRVSGWCIRLGQLLDRGAPELLLDGQFRAYRRMAETLVLSVHVLCGQANPGVSLPSCRVPVNYAGQIQILGTRIVVDCGIRYAGAAVIVDVREGRPVVPEVAAARVETEPAPTPGLVVPSGAQVDIGRCGSDPLLQARSLVVAVEHGPARPCEAAVPGLAVVPANASPQWRGASIAAATAHLRSVADGQSLLVDHDAGAPRVIAGIADSGHVTRLLALFEHGIGCGDADDEVVSTLRQIADWLNRAGPLTEYGERVTGRLAALGFRSIRRPEPVVSQRRQPPWMARWLSAGGKLREAAPAVTRLPAGSADLAALLAQLGASGGVEINTLGSERARADHTIDHLSLLCAREPEKFASVADQVAMSPPCVTGDLLAGHIAYIREQFEVAAETYARLLADLPYDIDLWRDFAFALRHLGEVELNELALFRLPEVVERACACQLELGTLDAVRAEPERWRSASAPVRLLVGILEWMSLDTDHG